MFAKTPILKNQRHKKYFKAVFGKDTLRTRKIIFFFNKNQACQTRPYDWDGLSPVTWAGLNG